MTNSDAQDTVNRVLDKIKIQDKALAVNPKQAEALFDKGVTLAKLGKYEEAIIWYDKALAINATDLDVLNNKGIALALVGKKQDALTLLEKALSIDPTNQKILELKSLLQE
jgi:Flp pilus assembly protein TadD